MHPPETKPRRDVTAAFPVAYRRRGSVPVMSGVRQANYIAGEYLSYARIPGCVFLESTL